MTDQNVETKRLWPTEIVPYNELTEIYRVGVPPQSKPKLPFKTWCEERARCRTDLLFLGIDVAGKLFTKQEHGEMADFFVKKDFSSLPVNYTRADVIKCFRQLKEEFHRRMLHCPRGSYKSTLDVLDALQWIINCPDIRLLILTGEKSLAISFIAELKLYFTVSEGCHRTKLQLLFPEFCDTARALGDANTFICPARKLDNREPTAWANSVVANLAGWHCDVMKCDDVVTDENSDTVERRQKLQKKFELACELLDPHGFLDFIGTRYSLDDLYGELLKKSKEEGEAPIKHLLIPVWDVLPGYEQIKLRDLTKDMVRLRYPSIMRWGDLKQKLTRNERQFRCQQLNMPIESLDCDFDEDMIRKCFVNPTSVPVVDGKRKLRVIDLWDTAISVKKTADFTVGIAIVIDDDEKIAYVKEIVWDRYPASAKAAAIVDLAARTKPSVIGIEESAGIENLMPEIGRIARGRKVFTPMRMLPKGNTSDVGTARIKGLEILLRQGKLKFSLGVTCLDEMVRQFTKFTTKHSKSKDDIIDALSFVQFFMPVADRPVVTEEQAEEMKKAKEAAEKKAYAEAYMKQVFNRGGAVPNQEPPNTPTAVIKKRNFDFRNFGVLK